MAASQRRALARGCREPHCTCCTALPSRHCVFPAWPLPSVQPRCNGGRPRCLRLMGVRLDSVRTATSRGQAAGSQSCVVARHHGDPCGLSGGAFRLESRRAEVAAARHAGCGSGHLVHRARAQARCAARRAPDGDSLRAGETRGDLSRRHDVGRPIGAAVPCQSAAGREWPARRRCSRSCWPIPIRRAPSAGRSLSSARPRWCRACGGLPAARPAGQRSHAGCCIRCVRPIAAHSPTS